MYIPFFRIFLDSSPKSGVLSAPFRPGRRGVRVVTTRGAGCGGCDGVVGRTASTGLVQGCGGLPSWRGAGSFADVEIVWSWHPDADAKLVVMMIRR